MTRLVAVIIWTVAVGWFCYDTGFLYGNAAGVRWATAVVYGP